MEFVPLSENLVEALVEPDSGKRRRAVEGWLSTAVPIAQAAVPDELRRCVENMMDVMADAKLWEKMRGKFDLGIYRLTLEFKFSRVAKKTEADQAVVAEVRETWDDGGGDHLNRGHSPNDDRSDSMNPNNPASQAAADNRSDQMNPNNPAYHSSRG